MCIRDSFAGCLSANTCPSVKSIAVRTLTRIGPPAIPQLRALCLLLGTPQRLALQALSQMRVDDVHVTTSPRAFRYVATHLGSSEPSEAPAAHCSGVRCDRTHSGTAMPEPNDERRVARDANIADDGDDDDNLVGIKTQPEVQECSLDEAMHMDMWVLVTQYLFSSPSLAYVRKAANACVTLHSAVLGGTSQLVFQLGEQLSIADATGTVHWHVQMARLARLGGLALPHIRDWLSLDEPKKCTAAAILIGKLRVAAECSLLPRMLQLIRECLDRTTEPLAQQTIQDDFDPLYELVNSFANLPVSALAQHDDAVELFAGCLSANTCPSVKSIAVRTLTRAGQPAIPHLMKLFKATDHTDGHQHLSVIRLALQALSKMSADVVINTTGVESVVRRHLDYASHGSSQSNPITSALMKLRATAASAANSSIRAESSHVWWRGTSGRRAPDPNEHRVGIGDLDQHPAYRQSESMRW
eukprot:TRINITY_DN3240_c0_g1_i3.p1 TRINITY_DN3240_c0_g1~~TRINITY_DN3240_c0_g1_i3.p1  ORF type:complete len:471 (+),score=75.38 TRINITY_DN3240_c0_g1_i3:137-1549(+)